MKIGYICSIIGLALATVILASGANASSDADMHWTIGPGEYDYEIIPTENEFQRVNIVVLSDIPVDIYVLDNDQYLAFTSAGYVTSYEERYETRTEYELIYVYPDETVRFMVVINPSASETANVTIENNLIIKDIEGDDDDDSGPCGSFLVAVIGGMVLITASLVFMKKRRVQ